MKPLVVYHKGCMDGAGAALAAWLKFGEEAEYRPASYGDSAPTDDEVRGRDVYVLDFSYPRAELERMDRACGETTHHPDGGALIVLDHHKTAQADLEGLPFCTFDMSKSGAALAWEHFHKTAPIFDKTYPTRDLPELFAYIQDRDLWRWELPHSREVSAALGASGALTNFRALISIYNGWGALTSRDAVKTYAKNRLIDEGAAILRAERLMVERVAATAEEIRIGTICHCCGTNAKNWRDVDCPKHVLSKYEVLAATSAVLQSEVGEALALESARRGLDAIGVVYYKDGPSGKWRVSLRSRDIRRETDTTNLLVQEAPDVSAIAKSFGGGGHHRAAGFECDLLPWGENLDVNCPHGVAINRTRCLKCAELDFGWGNRPE